MCRRIERAFAEEATCQAEVFLCYIDLQGAENGDEEFRCRSHSKQLHRSQERKGIRLSLMLSKCQNSSRKGILFLQFTEAARRIPNVTTYEPHLCETESGLLHFLQRRVHITITMPRDEYVWPPAVKGAIDRIMQRQQQCVTPRWPAPRYVDK